MKNWKEIVKSPAFIGLLAVCLVSLGIMVYLWVQLSKTYAALDELNARVAELNAELEELQAAAGSESKQSKEDGGVQASQSGSLSSAVQSSQQTQGSSGQQVQTSKYISKAKVKEAVLGDSQKNEASVTFTEFELDESADPAVYNVIFETNDGRWKFIYKVNAGNGLIRYRTFYNSKNWVPEETVGLYYEGGYREDEGDFWNEYWEEGYRPADMSFYDDRPIIDMDSEEWWELEQGIGW